MHGAIIGGVLQGSCMTAIDHIDGVINMVAGHVRENCLPYVDRHQIEIQQDADARYAACTILPQSYGRHESVLMSLMSAAPGENVS